MREWEKGQGMNGVQLVGGGEVAEKGLSQRVEGNQSGLAMSGTRLVDGVPLVDRGSVETLVDGSQLGAGGESVERGPSQGAGVDADRLEVEGTQLEESDLGQGGSRLEVGVEVAVLGLSQGVDEDQMEVEGEVEVEEGGQN